MYRHANLFLNCLLLLAISVPGYAQDTDKPAGPAFVQNVSNKGTIAAAFLEIGIGARAEAMGGSYTAQAGEVEAIYWNPAGLAYLDGPGRVVHAYRMAGRHKFRFLCACHSLAFHRWYCPGCKFYFPDCAEAGRANSGRSGRYG